MTTDASDDDHVTRHAGEARRLFALSWLAYASYYFGRKGWSVVKASMGRELGLSSSALGAIDTGYLLAYALGQLPSGLWVDRFGPRRILVGGMLLSAAACVLFAEQRTLLALVACFALNGLAQATGYPSCTNLVARSVQTSGRGRALGLWSTCYQVGGVVATAWATWLLANHGVRAAFYGPAAWLAAVGLLCAFLLPATAAAPTRDTLPPTAAAHAGSAALASRDALRSVRLYSYGACYFCLKLIRYSLLFWLPYYLSTDAALSPSASGYVSTAFEVGGVIGSVALGALSDRRRHARAGFAGASMLLLGLGLWAYAHAPFGASLVWHVSMLALLGALVYGPDSLLSGAAAQEAASPQAAGTAVGLVNGLGSLGALFQAAVTVSLQRTLGWNGVFLAFVALSVVGAMCLLPGMLRRSELPA